MKILLIDNGTTLLESLKKLIPGEEIVHCYDNLNNLNYEDFDLIILSGGSILNVESNQDKLQKEFEIIQNFKKPIIGICYGCEVIVKSFGGKLEKMNTSSKGIVDVSIISDNPIFANLEKIKVYENHIWKINEVPKDFNVLAESENSIEIIKHNQKEIYGFQFHPEHFMDKTQGDEIFLNLFNQIKNNI
jgi:GMP synthase (glutamine-hydrolysing)